MELSIKSIILLSTIFITGLSAGLFFAWQVSVIPGTQKLFPFTYLKTMQSINREILNPTFYLSFFGPLILLLICCMLFYQQGLVFYFLLAAAIVYGVGTIGVTAFGNVPLNDMLDVVNITEMSPEAARTFKNDYEEKWNRWHLLRTICAGVSFLITLLTIITD